MIFSLHMGVIFQFSCSIVDHEEVPYGQLSVNAACLTASIVLVLFMMNALCFLSRSEIPSTCLPISLRFFNILSGFKTVKIHVCTA